MERRLCTPSFPPNFRKTTYIKQLPSICLLSNILTCNNNQRTHRNSFSFIRQQYLNKMRCIKNRRKEKFSKSKSTMYNCDVLSVSIHTENCNRILQIFFYVFSLSQGYILIIQNFILVLKRCRIPVFTYTNTILLSYRVQLCYQNFLISQEKGTLISISKYLSYL